jgi:exodeoxyribonuclease-5
MVNFGNPSEYNRKNRASISSFTDDQKKAYVDLLEFINAEYNPLDYKRALVGPAGTGKTYLVKALIMNSNISYSLIGLSAPTHKAARVLNESIRLPNIKVNTLQSDLGLKLNFDVEKFDISSPPFDPRGRIKIGDFKLYIVDESSMINRSLLGLLEKVAKSNKVKLIYIGDSSQLPPVGELYSPAFKGIKTFSLTEIVRQGDDNPISILLNILRDDIKNKTYNFLNYIYNNPSRFNQDYIKGYQVCNSADFQQLVYTNFRDEELTKNVDYAKVVAFTNHCVSYWNKLIRNAIIEDCDKSIITKNDLIIAYTTIVNKFNEAVIKNSEEYILQDVVNYVHPRYELKGFMVRFIAIHGGNTTTPLFVIDHSDRFTVSKYVQMSKSLIDAAKSAKSSQRAQCWRDYYEFKESCLLLADIMTSDMKILYKRDLDYGFALTSHKSQGSTFDTVFVDVNDIVYNTKTGRPWANAEEVNRRLYVACSRAKNKLYLKFGK